MFYTVDISMLVTRYVPVWFRRERNVQFAVVLASWLERIQDDFLVWREGVVLAQYRYNGLLHSLERLLNDRYDPVERRIYIDVVDQVPGYWFLEDGQPAIASLLEDGALSGYAYLDDGEMPELYTHEFTVHVPAALAFNPDQVFSLLDTYRYAGRRPAIRVFDADDSTLATILYHTTPVANQP